MGQRYRILTVKHMTFIPKSHVPLQDAINKIGGLESDNWSGEEFNPENWNAGFSYGRFNEKEVHIADAIAEVALEQWGDSWVQAAERFFQQLDLEITYIQRKAEIDALKANVQDEKQAYGWIVLREAARYIYKRAKLSREPTDPILTAFVSPQTEIQPPFIETEEGPDPLELDEATLASYEQGAEEEFASVDALRLEAQSRFIAVTDWFRQELFEGQLAVAYLAENGQLVEISKETWATDRALDLFMTCQFEEYQLLVSATFFERYQTDVSKRDYLRNATSVSKSGAGRKPKYNWAAAKAYIETKFEYNGALSRDDPEWRCQADVEKAIKVYFCDEHGQEPATSTVRAKAKEFISGIEAKYN